MDQQPTNEGKSPGIDANVAKGPGDNPPIAQEDPLKPVGKNPEPVISTEPGSAQVEGSPTESPPRIVHTVPEDAHSAGTSDVTEHQPPEGFVSGAGDPMKAEPQGQNLAAAAPSASEQPTADLSSVGKGDDVVEPTASAPEPAPSLTSSTDALAGGFSASAGNSVGEAGAAVAGGSTHPGANQKAEDHGRSLGGRAVDWFKGLFGGHPSPKTSVPVQGTPSSGVIPPPSPAEQGINSPPAAEPTHP